MTEQPKEPQQPESEHSIPLDFSTDPAGKELIITFSQQPAPAAAETPYPVVFMQWHGDGEARFPLPDADAVTWSLNQIYDSDIAYSPASELSALRARLAEVERVLQATQKSAFKINVKLINILHKYGTGETEEHDGEDIIQMVERIATQRDAAEAQVKVLRKAGTKLVACLNAIKSQHLIGHHLCASSDEAVKGFIHADSFTLAQPPPVPVREEEGEIR